MIDRLYILTKISPLPNHVYRINKEIRINNYIIPEGYITNGADIPRLFRFYISPNESEILPAVILHDYLCDTAKLYFAEYRDIKTSLMLFNKADDAFREVLMRLRDSNYANRKKHKKRFLFFNTMKVHVLYRAVMLYTKIARPVTLAYMLKFNKNYDIKRLKKILRKR